MTGNELQVIFSGIGHELKFWKRFIESKQFASWLAPGVTPELHLDVVGCIKSVAATTSAKIKILDAGSGVVSILNGIADNVEIVTADPLGEMYECIFDYKRHGIQPPLPLPAEALTFEKEFDIVHMRNALDHSQDPTNAYLRLFDACKPGGYIIIHGFENEAIAENWQGFHQWNISTDAHGYLAIKGKDKDKDEYIQSNGICISEPLPNSDKTWFLFISRKPETVA